MPPLRSFRQKSRSSSKRRKFSDVVQREVKRLLPTIIHTINQHNGQNNTRHPPPPPPHSPSPPPFHSPLMSSPRNDEKMLPQNQTKPLCNTCRKRHHGVCFRATGKCFRCGEADHMIKDCPKPNGNVVGNASRSASVVPPTTGGRVFTLSVGNAPTEAELAKKPLKHHELLG
ncbi:hypothetical protein E3N88_24296 [Mikania micrantha]|uniref:CCHC-type domain-containing protein n=1 Tax=Mikania micrantha TaxID=192012 RepID=A0A5N6NI81_9ASTR|nr:hypothetical protein E3N88_24296 [Mikania micrantha]